MTAAPPATAPPAERTGPIAGATATVAVAVAVAATATAAGRFQAGSGPGRVSGPNTATRRSFTLG
ncbi:MAG TPA: hypothetical protein VFN48_05670 [Solirubrobacteraceae bacterium]|nr:hypothetical protein [Solirubrobacteraceae bacterium]